MGKFLYSLLFTITAQYHSLYDDCIRDLEIRSKTSRKAVTKLGGVLDTVILTNAPPSKINGTIQHTAAGEHHTIQGNTTATLIHIHSLITSKQHISQWQIKAIQFLLVLKMSQRPEMIVPRTLVQVRLITTSLRVLIHCKHALQMRIVIYTVHYSVIYIVICIVIYIVI